MLSPIPISRRRQRCLRSNDAPLVTLLPASRTTSRRKDEVHVQHRPKTLPYHEGPTLAKGNLVVRRVHYTMYVAVIRRVNRGVKRKKEAPRFGPGLRAKSWRAKPTHLTRLAFHYAPQNRTAVFDPHKDGE